MVSVFRTETWSCGIVNLVGDETYSCVQSASVVVVTMLGTNQDLTDWQCVHLCWMISDVVEAVSRRNSWCQASSLGGCVCSGRLPPSFLTVLIDDLRVLLPLQVWLHIHILLIATFRHVVSERTFSSILDDYCFFVSLISSLSQNTVLSFPLFRVGFLLLPMANDSSRHVICERTFSSILGDFSFLCSISYRKT